MEILLIKVPLKVLYLEYAKSCYKKGFRKAEKDVKIEDPSKYEVEYNLLL